MRPGSRAAKCSQAAEEPATQQTSTEELMQHTCDMLFLCSNHDIHTPNPQQNSHGPATATAKIGLLVLGGLKIRPLDP